MSLYAFTDEELQRYLAEGNMGVTDEELERYLAEHCREVEEEMQRGEGTGK